MKLMFEDILIHDTAAMTLRALANKPPQSLLLIGPSGVGKTTMAEAWARNIATQPSGVRIVEPDEKGSISIDAVRELYRAGRSKQAGRQVIVILDIDTMSIEAENAFLKLLEEPREGLIFVLTAASTEAILPTILSRVQTVTVSVLTDETIRRFIVEQKPGIADSDLAQLVFIAQGRPGIAASLLEGDALDKQRVRMQTVKQLLTASLFERFVFINSLARDRQACLEDLSAMLRIVEVQVKNASDQGKISHWLQLANTLEATLQAIQANGNMRAQLLRLFSSY